jgi:TM2 domain-containing membrane protein YozV
MATNAGQIYYGRYVKNILYLLFVKNYLFIFLQGPKLISLSKGGGHI